MLLPAPPLPHGALLVAPCCCRVQATHPRAAAPPPCPLLQAAPHVPHVNDCFLCKKCIVDEALPPKRLFRRLQDGSGSGTSTLVAEALEEPSPSTTHAATALPADLAVARRAPPPLSGRRAESRYSLAAQRHKARFGYGSGSSSGSSRQARSLLTGLDLKEAEGSAGPGSSGSSGSSRQARLGLDLWEAEAKAGPGSSSSSGGSSSSSGSHPFADSAAGPAGYSGSSGCSGSSGSRGRSARDLRSAAPPLDIASMIQPLDEAAKYKLPNCR